MPTRRSIPVLRVALPVPLRQTFDYLDAENDVIPQAGQRVVVMFGRRKMVGVIVEVADGSDLPHDKLSKVLGYPDDGSPVLSFSMRFRHCSEKQAVRYRLHRSAIP